ncbi:MAG: hypothetical protein PHF86_06435 [Candidatus Nanoarchaeia archaeon]|jgi:hypothetical protein|nr:hypothetical protein [Candidatus Nanoarchaeia archaeon]
MSETEAFKGKLKEFPREPGETLVQYVTRFIESKGREVPSYYAGCAEDEADLMFYDVFYKEVGAFVNDIIYEILEMKDLEDDDIFDAQKAENGMIDFTIKYYNGSCSFSEALGRAFEKMNKPL